MKQREIQVPAGFSFASACAGIKASGRADLAYAEATNGASAAAVFTTNRVVAAPVLIGRAHLKRSRGYLAALVVNSGNANCATGEAGVQATEHVCAALADLIDVPYGQVFPSSTGIIGVPLPTEKIIRALPQLVSGKAANAEAALGFARAIMTTDTRPKLASACFECKGKTVTVLGMAKGAGMIHPNMATMLAYIFTDLEVEPADVAALLRDACAGSFNSISIDGDTSTNDTVLLQASGASGCKLRAARKQFTQALHDVCTSLAEQIVSDGEGVQHVIRLHIEGARNHAEAATVARTVANSPLVKTAWAGADPNWGRILAAVGRAPMAKLDPDRVNIFIGDQQVCRNGGACDYDPDAAHHCMSQPSYDIRVDLGQGRARKDFLTCDMTTKYVKINSEYST
jgi:glutamate N-acetyltransferase / amino-acid N-acetyltransferase